MKTPLLIMFFIFGVFVATLSCTTPQQQSAAKELHDAFDAASKDGQITEDEAKLIGAKLKAFTEAPGVDWAQVGGTVLASVAMTFLGLRYVPNAHVIGPAEAAALNKAAGLG